MKYLDQNQILFTPNFGKPNQNSFA